MMMPTRWAAMLLALTLVFSCGCSKKPGAQAPTQTLAVEKITVANGLPDDLITALAVFSGKLWVGTKKGIGTYDGVNWGLRVKKNTNVLGSDIIEELSVWENALWICTDNGVARFDGTNWSSLPYRGRARSVAAKGNEIAIATAHGIEYSDGQAFKAYGKEAAGLVNDEVQEVVYDASGKLWVGTRAGMALFSGGIFQNHTGPQQQPMGTSLVDIPPNPPSCQLIGNNIKVMLPFQGKLVIGTTSGLNVTDMGTSWLGFSAPHKEWVQRAGRILEEQKPGNSPLPGNSIQALAALPGDGGFFVGTNKGLALYRDGKWVDVVTVLGGLPSGALVSSLAILNDDLWVGTQLGLYRVKGIKTLFPAPAN